MVGRILHDLCVKKKITILCTIHQPRYALARMFDKLYFLAKGNEIYFGPTIPYCLTFFEKAGYPYVHLTCIFLLFLSVLKLCFVLVIIFVCV